MSATDAVNWESAKGMSFVVQKIRMSLLKQMLDCDVSCHILLMDLFFSKSLFVFPTAFNFVTAPTVVPCLPYSRRIIWNSLCLSALVLANPDIQGTTLRFSTICMHFCMFRIVLLQRRSLLTRSGITGLTLIQPIWATLHSVVAVFRLKSKWFTITQKLLKFFYPVTEPLV